MWERDKDKLKKALNDAVEREIKYQINTQIRKLDKKLSSLDDENTKKRNYYISE